MFLSLLTIWLLSDAVYRLVFLGTFRALFGALQESESKLTRAFRSYENQCFCSQRFKVAEQRFKSTEQKQCLELERDEKHWNQRIKLFTQWTKDEPAKLKALIEHAEFVKIEVVNYSRAKVRHDEFWNSQDLQKIKNNIQRFVCCFRYYR